MRSVTLLVTAAAVFGCAEISDVVDASLGGGRTDALVGFTNDAARPEPQSDSAPLDATVRFDAAPLPPCTPGEMLDVCEVCDDAGQRVAPDRDERCPAIDCSALNHYRQASDPQDGYPICELVAHNPRGPNCAAVGRCRETADDTVCLPSPGVRVAAVQQPCQQILGCAGAEAPMVGPAPAGTPCQDDEGRCTDAGRCDTTISEACGHYAMVARVCGAGVHPTQGAYCAVGPLEPTDHCTAFCIAQNATCAAGYEAGPDGCALGQEIGCLQPAASLVCYCRR